MIKVLIVDDSALIRSVLQTLLSEDPIFMLSARPATPWTQGEKSKP